MSKLLGIDESNHGHITEIFVGTFSIKQSSIIKNPNLTKLRYK
jgi:hypothetical protein